jgi:hypothetical protein
VQSGSSLNNLVMMPTEPNDEIVLLPTSFVREPPVRATEPVGPVTKVPDPARATQPLPVGPIVKVPDPVRAMEPVGPVTKVPDPARATQPLPVGPIVKASAWIGNQLLMVST